MLRASAPVKTGHKITPFRRNVQLSTVNLCYDNIRMGKPKEFVQH